MFPFFGLWSAFSDWSSTRVDFDATFAVISFRSCASLASVADIAGGRLNPPSGIEDNDVGPGFFVKFCGSLVGQLGVKSFGWFAGWSLF